MRRVLVDEEAIAESTDAQDYYAALRPELGQDFAKALDKAMGRIAAHPTMWPAFTARTRRYLLDRFPYAIVYTVEADDLIRVLAVHHQHRRPNYWRPRR